MIYNTFFISVFRTLNGSTLKIKSGPVSLNTLTWIVMIREIWCLPIVSISIGDQRFFPSVINPDSSVSSETSDSLLNSTLNLLSIPNLPHYIVFVSVPLPSYIQHKPRKTTPIITLNPFSSKLFQKFTGWIVPIP